jgi:ABC-2 type transport system permease protein
VHAEWTKLRTLPSTWWLLLAVVAATVAGGAAATASLSPAGGARPAGCAEDTVRLSLTGVWLGQGAVIVLAVLAIGGEYGTGTIGAALRAEPGRLRLLGAKAVVVGALTALAGGLAVLGSLVAGRLLLPAGVPAPPGLDEAPVSRAAAGTVAFLVRTALTALGAATALRDTATAVTSVLGLFYGLPLLTALVADPGWRETAERLTPTTAAHAIRTTAGLDRLPLGPGAGLAVLVGYAVVALFVGAVALRVRDA